MFRQYFLLICSVPHICHQILKHFILLNQWNCPLIQNHQNFQSRYQNVHARNYTLKITVHWHILVLNIWLLSITITQLELLLHYILFSGAKHIPLFSQSPFHFYCSIGAFLQCWDKHNKMEIFLIFWFLICLPQEDFTLSTVTAQLDIVEKCDGFNFPPVS